MSHILIIDDEYQIRKMLRRLLESKGYTVSDAGDGKTALTLYKNNPADLIITDIIMPEKEGLETIMDFTKLYPGIKIIAISGGGKNNPDEYLNLAKLLGAQKIFHKPLKNKELLEAIQSLI